MQETYPSIGAAIDELVVEIGDGVGRQQNWLNTVRRFGSTPATAGLGHRTVVAGAFRQGANAAPMSL